VLSSNRERLKTEFTRAALLRELYPQLAEVRVELAFQDGTARTPSAQSFSYFPAARGFFRYACPCQSCNGEFDLTMHVAELAGKSGHAPRTHEAKVSCGGQRIESRDAQCPVCAQVRVSAIVHPKEQSA
jgi:hypothetical protein